MRSSSSPPAFDLFARFPWLLRVSGWLGYLIIWAIIGGVMLALFHWHESSSQLSAQVMGEGYVDLQPNAHGHYTVAGAVNDTPLHFMLDTGATTTALSREFARQAGITSCRPGYSNTANGVTEMCMATAARLGFAGFQLANVRVAILPRLEGEALLGMNVLRHFAIEQRAGRLRIAAPGHALGGR
ncbi:MAG: retroviral-like aspartic protease family protein [Diaphorobacter sp.]|nr:retroviral-like aspartic protease family protein [Diaphorobacter sp.]